MLALHWQLARTERWPAERLVAHQFFQIRQLLAHAIANVPFYRSHLERCGVSSPDELGPESFARWPLLRIRDVQDSNAQLRAVRLPESHGVVFERFTSGSTAAPKRIASTDAAALVQSALVLRDHLWQQRDLSAKFAAIRFFHKQGVQPGWSPTTNAAFATGPSAVLGVERPVDEQLRWLVAEDPAYLLTSPSNLNALVRQSVETGVRPHALRQVLTYAEVLDPSLRTKVMAAWGVPLADTYSTTEAGPIALQCPGRTTYHVQSESVYAEVLRDDGTPCPPGEVGRLVVTPLHNFAMPLLRYDSGDYAIAGEACPCGRGLPVLERVIGRARNMARDAKGRRFQPGFDVALDASRLPVRQVRFVQQTYENIQMSYVADRDLTSAEMEAFQRSVREKLPYRLKIGFRRVAEIERSPSGKYESFVSLVDDA